MPLFFWDSTLLLLIPALLLTIYAQIKVTTTFRKYSQVRSMRGLTGAEGARLMLDSANLKHVGIEVIEGDLTDHYDPRTKVLRLSARVGTSDSLAALGVAAHEAGHALQDAEGYSALRLRGAMVQSATLGSNLGFFLFFLGLIMGGNQTLMAIGILLFALFVIFTLVTLPVEFNASKRALAQLSGHGILAEGEIDGARAVLNAAALTYVAAAVMAIMNLLRLILIRGRG
jgi:hypothetical protein